MLEPNRRIELVMTVVHLAKLHATGNDFLVRLALDGEPDVSVSDAAWLCDRHRGVGADGLITVGRSPEGIDAHCSFRLQNADGSDAEMSGNGMRALAAIAAGPAALGEGDELRVATPAGLRTIEIQRNAQGVVVAATVDMGAARFDPEMIPVRAEANAEITTSVHGVNYRGEAVGMGNPHWVLFVDNVASARVTQHGRWLQTDDRFPNETNVEFVHVLSRQRMEMRVWERGVGETLSCGTGACAAAAAAHRRGLIDDTITMVVPGGELQITIGATIRLGGPVVHAFDVSVDLSIATEGR